MKKPSKIHRKLRVAARKAFTRRPFRGVQGYYTPPPLSLRSAFRGVEWVIAGMFSGATLCRLWVQKYLAALAAMKVPYRGNRLSALFAMMAGVGRRPLPQPRPELR
ncbi:MAG TPA: hypothetical protein PLK94_11400 [Alphaproteobacteria bacterium]|nr:hypothetical protein [Alphaproteobacteria bacterium]HOO51883.1 hypothetical protein [Alphaproteobacteria bacterium]